ncbi:MAG: glycosyl hydrolase family 8, partial [Fibrobacterota bacterium]
WDKLKNRSIDSIVVSRKGLPDTTAPTLKLLGPSSGTELALETEFVALRWQVTDPSGLADTSVKIDGKVAKRNTDTFSLEVVAPAPGREEIHRIDAKNRKGVSNFETMSLKRAKDATAPKLLRVDSGRTVPFETEKAVVSWKVTDNDKLSSVTIAGKVVVGVDGLYSLEAALTTGDNRIAITATDSASNSSSDTIVVHRTWKDTSKPVLVRQPGTEDKNVAFATTEFTASWKATDNALSRVKINDTAVTGVDGIYSYKATLAQASTKFKIEAIDSSGNSKLDSITVTKSDDLTDPVAVRLPGTQDTTVPYATSSYALGWEVRDDNGVDSVTVNGLAATKNEGSYRLSVALPTVGQHRFIMVAKDVAGNDARDTIRIRRAYHDSIAPQKTRGATTKDTTAPYGTKTYKLSWTVTDNDMVKSVTIGSGVATVSGNVYSRTVDLVDGPNKVGMLAIDTAGNKGTDTVTIKVAADSAVPAISREVGTKDSAVAYGTTSISLKWKITDDAGVSSVKVNGVLVSSSSGVYTWNATGLNIGANVFRIVAVDVVNKSSSDSVVITRAWKDSVSPVVSRRNGGPARVASTIDTATLSWSVSDSMLKEVRLNDVALVGQSGVFTKTISLIVGSNPVVLVAEDRAGNLTTDTFTIFRNEPPRYGLLPYPEIVGRYPGSDPTLDPYLKAAWEKWKANFLTDGTVYAATPSGTNQLTSEGQAYGMLLALWFGDQAVFDRIWWATESRLWNGSDLWYNWAVGDRAFAGGADIQICGALIMASALVDEGLWPDNMIPTSGISYKTKAKTLIQSIGTSIIDRSSNYRVSTWQGAGDGIRNPSYHMPAWYAVFKEFSALNGLTGMNWDAATKGAHDLFDAQPFASVGMVRNYSTGTGGTANGGTSTPTNYDMGFDAIKVPWLQALANNWHHDVRAGSWCANVWKGGVVSPEAAGMYQLSSPPRLWGWVLGEYERVMTMGMWGACAVSVSDSSTEAKTASESLSKTMIDALRSDAAFSVPTKNWHAQTNALLGTLAITGRAWNVWGDLKNLCSPCGP